MTTAREDTVRLAELLRREHNALGDFLVALSVFDRERRWSELGYSGLFSFLTRELRLSNGAAQNRKTAAELIQRFPDVGAALRNGDLCLSSVNELAKVITAENAADLLPRFYGKSARDAAFLAAAIRPVENPPERFLVTPVRVSATPAVPASPERGLELHTYEVPAAATAAPLPVPLPSLRPTITPVDAERARMNITVPRRLLEKLATARDALSHSRPGASPEVILELGLDLIIQRHRKRRGIGAKPRVKKAAPAPETAAAGPAPVAGAPTPTLAGEETSAAPPPVVATKRSRHVPAAVAREVWERDHGCCAWKLENGGVCGSTSQLEFDHIAGWALGAGMTVEELRLLCKFHQDVHARALYGDDLMNRYTRPKGPRCSEAVAVWNARPRRQAFRHARSACSTSTERCSSYGHASATSFPSPSPRSRRGGRSPRSRAAR
jgi:hypothetical protein